MEWLGVGRGHSTIRQSTYEFLLAFYSNYVPVLHCYCNIASYWSKIANCNISRLYLVPTLSTKIFGTRKLATVGYRTIFFPRSYV